MHKVISSDLIASHLTLSLVQERISERLGKHTASFKSNKTLTIGLLKCCVTYPM